MGRIAFPRVGPHVERPPAGPDTARARPAFRPLEGRRVENPGGSGDQAESGRYRQKIHSSARPPRAPAYQAGRVGGRQHHLGLAPRTTPFQRAIGMRHGLPVCRQERSGRSADGDANKRHESSGSFRGAPSACSVVQSARAGGGRGIGVNHVRPAIPCPYPSSRRIRQHVGSGSRPSGRDAPTLPRAKSAAVWRLENGHRFRAPMPPRACSRDEEKRGGSIQTRGSSNSGLSHVGKVEARCPGFVGQLGEGHACVPRGTTAVRCRPWRRFQDDCAFGPWWSSRTSGRYK
jgi:hypothetical protein